MPFLCIHDRRPDQKPSSVRDAGSDLPDSDSIGERISNVVVMGTGEPLDNYDNLLRFIHILTEDGGIHISQRNITVSTCGLVPKIYELQKKTADDTGCVSSCTER